MAAQGRESSQDEKGASALLAVALDDEYGGRPVQVRPFSSTFDTQIEQNRRTFLIAVGRFHCLMKDKTGSGQNKGSIVR